MNILHNLMGRLRALVASKDWDYCVLWKLSDDQRCIEWADCCCGGAVQNGEKVDQFAVNSALSCRDMTFQHPRTKSCDLLVLLPCSIPLNTSGIHAQVLLSNQFRWLQLSNALDSNVSSEESLGTKVLVPVPGGLLELFVTKQVAEDQGVIDFIVTQCSISLEQEALNIRSTAIMGHGYEQEKGSNNVMDMNQYRNEMDLEGYMNRSINCGAENVMSPVGQDQMVDPFQSSRMLMMGDQADHEHKGEGVKKEINGRGDSVSDCSDLNMDDEDETGRYKRGTNGKGHQSKNLMAERKRRKKLNERLYNLRSLVPKISKLDRASILGDAIEYVRELENQVKELQDELAEQSDEDGGTKNSCVTSTADPPADHEKIIINTSLYDVNNGPASSKQNADTESTNDKTQQMEPQVEVAQIVGNEFFVKVFSEHKTGGFLRLMEVLEMLGLEVTNANVTSFRGLVSNVFKVEKKDSEMLQTDYVRETLLEVTRNPTMSSRGWVEMMECPSETNDGGVSTACAGDCRHLGHHDGHQPQLSHHLHEHPLITPTNHLHHFHN